MQMGEEEEEGEPEEWMSFLIVSMAVRKKLGSGLPTTSATTPALNSSPETKHPGPALRVSSLAL